MLVGKNAKFCETCKRKARSEASFFQKIILALLLFLFVIPGIIYFLIAKPKDCYICGLKMNKNYGE